MKKNLIISLLLISNIIFSQKTEQRDTIWYNYFWKKTNKENAKYFRPLPKKVKKGYLITDYYINKKKQMEAISLEKDTVIFNGEVKYYNNNGELEHKANYKKNVLSGESIKYHENGKISEIKNYKNGKIILNKTKAFNSYGTTIFPTQTGDYFVKLRKKTRKSIDYKKFKNNNGEFKIYFPGGNLALIGQYKKGKEDGQWRWYDKVKGIILKENYSKGLREGNQYIYFDDVPKISIPFSKDKMHGMAVTYENGKAVDNLFFIENIEVKDRNDFEDLFYLNNPNVKITTRGNFRHLDFTKKGTDTKLSLDENKLNLKLLMDYHKEKINKNDFQHLKKSFHKFYFNSEDRHLDSIKINIKTSNQLTYLKNEYSNHKTIPNEVLILILDLDKNIESSFQIYFKIGDKIRKSLKKKSLESSEIISFLLKFDLIQDDFVFQVYDVFDKETNRK